MKKYDSRADQDMLHTLQLYLRAYTTGDCQVCLLQLLLQLHDLLIPAPELLIPFG